MSLRLNLVKGSRSPEKTSVRFRRAIKKEKDCMLDEFCALI